MNTKRNKITWTIDELTEVLKGDWGIYSLFGVDKYGRRYSGSVQAEINNPEFYDFEVYEIQMETGWENY